MHAADVIRGRPRARAAASRSLIGCTVLVEVVSGCWVLSALRMEGMDAGPGGYLGATGWFLATWILMMSTDLYVSSHE